MPKIAPKSKGFLFYLKGGNVFVECNFCGRINYLFWLISIFDLYPLTINISNWKFNNFFGALVLANNQLIFQTMQSQSFSYLVDIYRVISLNLGPFIDLMRNLVFSK